MVRGVRRKRFEEGAPLSTAWRHRPHRLALHPAAPRRAHDLAEQSWWVWARPARRHCGAPAGGRARKAAEGEQDAEDRQVKGGRARPLQGSSHCSQRLKG